MLSCESLKGFRKTVGLGLGLVSASISMIANAETTDYSQQMALISSGRKLQVVGNLESFRKVVARRNARERAKFVGTLLEFDLDGDGKFDEIEVETISQIDRENYDPNPFVYLSDKDKDGEIDFAEIVAAAHRTADVYGRLIDADSVFAAYDADKDGIVTSPEAIEVLNANRIWQRCGEDKRSPDAIERLRLSLNSEPKCSFVLPSAVCSVRLQFC